MTMLTIASLLWDPNGHTFPWSFCYDESWVDKLYRGFARNLTVPFRFVLFTDRERAFSEPIEQMIVPDLGKGGYGDCIIPYKLGEPMILVGLDTAIVGNIDHLAAYCLKTQPTYPIGLPRDPYFLQRACNGVALVPAGKRQIFTKHRGQNDMEWLRAWPHAFLDDLFPGQIVSYKAEVRAKGIEEAGDIRIVYFHGEPKMHALHPSHWILQHWK